MFIKYLNETMNFIVSNKSVQIGIIELCAAIKLIKLMKLLTLSVFMPVILPFLDSHKLSIVIKAILIQL